MHRFFVTPGSMQPGHTVSLDDYAHQLYSVLRLRAGATITLLDGSGMEFAAQLVNLDARHAQAIVGAATPCATEPAVDVTLYLCSLKGEKFEWGLQKSVELGVRRIVPVVSARSIVRPVAALAGKAQRWRSVIREAAEQSRRALLPELGAPMDFAGAIAAAHGLKLIAWEDVPGGGGIHVRAQEPVSLLIGPEGGLEPAEVELARAAGWQALSLGPRILRAETAAVAALAAVMALAGELGDLRP